MSVEELVFRMRDHADFALKVNHDGTHDILTRAADKLEELAAELKRLTYSRDGYAKHSIERGKECDRLQAALAEKDKEIAALKARLSKIIAKDSYIDASPRGGRRIIYGDFANIARNAGGKE